VEHFGAVSSLPALIIAFFAFLICFAAHQIELSLGLAWFVIERVTSQTLGKWGGVMPGREGS
jgi:hypothetical protein